MGKREIVEILKEAAKETEQKYKARIKGVFGSFARDEEDSNSDIDILVDFAEGADLIHFAGLSLFLEEKLGRKIDVVPHNALRSEIKDEVLKEAIYL